MQGVIENKLQALQKDLEQLENKKISFNDIKGYKENHLNIRLCKAQMGYLYKMIEDEDFEVKL